MLTGIAAVAATVTLLLTSAPAGAQEPPPDRDPADEEEGLAVLYEALQRISISTATGRTCCSRPSRGRGAGGPAGGAAE